MTAADAQHDTGYAAIAGDILARIDAVLPKGAKRPVALHEPRFDGHEKDYVVSTIEDNWVSSAGPFVTKFEENLAAFTGMKHAIAVSNGTVAIHAMLVACGVNAGDEVIIPSLTFVATANAVSHAHAHVHLVDCEETSLGIDAQKLRAHLAEVTEQKDGQCVNKDTGRRIAAIMPVHIFGLPCDLDAISAVADEFNLPVLQDAAEGLGSTYKGKSVFQYGRCAATSFNGNKIMTCGGGGAILTNDEVLGKRLKHLTNTAKVAHAYEFYHDAVGYNYRMPNINAALATAQLEQMPRYLKDKEVLRAKYADTFRSCNAARLLGAPENTVPNNWLNALVLADADPALRDTVLKYLNDNGIGARPIWVPMHRLPMYENAYRADLSVTEDMVARVINIPSSFFLAGA